MNYRCAWLVFLLLPSLGHSASAPIAFTHVTVIDVDGSKAQADQTVVVAGDRISAVGRADAVAIPKDAQVVDGTGKFMIPGLWDMHVHLYGVPYLPLFTLNGVTGVRVMWGNPSDQELRRDFASGKLDGPRMMLAGSIIDGPKPYWPGSTGVGTADEGRQAVRKTKADGYDFVKVYSFLPRDAYLAIADEAKKLGIPIAGHVPYSVSVAEASDAGQKCFEHLYGIMLACSTQEEKLSEQVRVAIKDPHNPDRALLRRINEQIIDTYDATKAAALFAKFKNNGTWQCPTLTVLRSLAYLDDPKHTSDERLKYMPKSFRSMWDPKSDFRFKSMTKEDFAQRKKLFDRSLELVGAMQRAGVSFVAGTDLPNPYCFPGFSIHNELEWFVKAGLSPIEALQTATLNPARYFGLTKDCGSVEQGKFADLVLLDADPLVNISNTQKIAGVVAAGKYIPQTILQKKLAEIAELASRN